MADRFLVVWFDDGNRSYHDRRRARPTHIWRRRLGRGKQRRSRERKVTEVNHMPVRHAAVPGRILAHRSDDDPVNEFDRSHLKRREQLRRGHCKPLFEAARTTAWVMS